ncbi:MAG: M15 family metallopeptidase [Clostridia bacterium]|nr:M15 family metallopeptidase [Clostridia bacterium]
MSALYFLFVVGNDTLDFSLTELISTDTEVIVSAENKPEKEDSAKINERLITVVNSNNRIDSGFTPKLYEYDGVFISKDMLSDLEEMMTEAEKNGLNLKITKGYVSYEEQQKTYEDTINYFENEMGYSSVKSEEYAMKTTPDGESCEYRTGLLISFDSGNENFEKTSEYIWLYNNCVKYGFVLRYPEKKENYTGYEPIYNTFRYVGKENAKRMRMLDMSLEEYRNYIDNQSTSI